MDHLCVFQSADGAWHLWGCIRRTAVGRMLYRWEGQGLELAPWQPTGEIIRADPAAGESLSDRHGEEWIQSPFVVASAGQYYFFYGGHGTGLDSQGHPVARDDPRTECQMPLIDLDRRPALAAAPRLQDGFSRLFVGPGRGARPVRDRDRRFVASVSCWLSGWRPGAGWHLPAHLKRPDKLVG